MLLRQSQASARSTMCGSLCSGAALGGITKNLVQRYYVEGDPAGLSHLGHLHRGRHAFLQNKLSQHSELPTLHSAAIHPTLMAYTALGLD